MYNELSGVLSLRLLVHKQVSFDKCAFDKLNIRFHMCTTKFVVFHALTSLRLQKLTFQFFNKFTKKLPHPGTTVFTQERFVKKKNLSNYVRATILIIFMKCETFQGALARV